MEISQDHVKLRIFVELTCFATRMLVKYKLGLRESYVKVGERRNRFRVLSSGRLWN
jgi:hypothetical protein